jgi:pimeloyl-ACP methyl ester carboxylesterase
MAPKKRSACVTSTSMLTEAQITEGWFVHDHRGTPIWGRTVPESGPQAGRDVVLVHGAAAHLHWWDAMLAHIGRPWRTTVFDLSGHGRSGHRPDGYQAELWADELASVIAHRSRAGSAAVVAHSMGGLIATATAALFPERVEELVIVDVTFRPPHPATAHQLRGRPGRERTIHPDRPTAMRHFRLVPSGSTADPDVLQQLAALSYEQANGGWRVRFDPRVFQHFTDAMIHDWLGRIRCPVTLIGGELSPAVTEARADYVAGRVGRPIRWGRIPGAHHHVQLDNPAVLGDRLVKLLAGEEPPGLRWTAGDATGTSA